MNSSWSNITIELNSYFSHQISSTVDVYLALAIRTEWHFWCTGSQMTLCKCTWFSKTIELYCFSHKITEHCRRKQSLLPSQSLLFGPISVERTKYVTNIPTTYIYFTQVNHIYVNIHVHINKSNILLLSIGGFYFVKMKYTWSENCSNAQ